MTPSLPAFDALRGIRREVERTQMRARNGIGLIARRPPARIGLTPREEVWSLGKAKLWRYRNPSVRYRPPLLLFLGLVGDSSIFDIHPGNSWAERLVHEGFDVFLFDWGQPDDVEGDHTLESYLNEYFVHAIDAVRRIAAVDEVSMGAYCMGALMALLLLGSRDDVTAKNLVLFTPPCDYEQSPAFMGAFRDGRIKPGDIIDQTTGVVPGNAIRAMFRLLQPTSGLVQYVTLWEHLWSEEYVEPHRAVNHWAWNHRGISGPAFAQLITEYVQGNALMAGTAQLDERDVRLDRITAPSLIVIAEKDEFVPPAMSEPLRKMLGSEDVEVLRVPGGHAGALMGSAARRVTMPAVIDWLLRHSTPNTSTYQPSGDESREHNVEANGVTDV